jgi:hypothetical protein
MAVTVGTDSYGDETGLDAYALARGITVVGDQTIMLTKAMDWLEIQPWYSYKYLETQPLEFPRASTKYGDVVGEVPDDIITAQYVAALIFDGGGNLLESSGQSIKKEKVDVIEITYQDFTSGQISYPQLNGLVSPYLSSTGGSFTVTRG